jgi:uncharacterized Zn finger protein (UPF0148 family)
MKTCPKCSSPAADDDRFCGECGQRLNIAADNSTDNSLEADDLFGLPDDTPEENFVESAPPPPPPAPESEPEDVFDFGEEEEPQAEPETPVEEQPSKLDKKTKKNLEKKKKQKKKKKKKGHSGPGFFSSAMLFLVYLLINTPFVLLAIKNSANQTVAGVCSAPLLLPLILWILLGKKGFAMDMVMKSSLMLASILQILITLNHPEAFVIQAQIANISFHLSNLSLCLIYFILSLQIILFYLFRTFWNPWLKFTLSFCLLIPCYELFYRFANAMELATYGNGTDPLGALLNKFLGTFSLYFTSHFLLCHLALPALILVLLCIGFTCLFKKQFRLFFTHILLCISHAGYILLFLTSYQGDNMPSLLSSVAPLLKSAQAMSSFLP